MRRTDQRRAAVFSLYQHDVTGIPIDELVEHGPFANGRADAGEVPVAPGPLTDFGADLVRGVREHGSELDELISSNAVDWSVDRIAPLERAILRVALYEMLHRPDVPDEVAIDEAVETAKLFCGTDTPGFVNGILGGVERRLAGPAGGAA